MEKEIDLTIMAPTKEETEGQKKILLKQLEELLKKGERFLIFAVRTVDEDSVDVVYGGRYTCLDELNYVNHFHKTIVKSLKRMNEARK